MRRQQNTGSDLGRIGAMGALIVGALAIALSSLSIHKVPEGHIGVYWFGGALLNSTSSPGFNFMPPLLASVEFVQVTLQTDTVKDIPCGTSGGSIIYFDKIEVVNRLSAAKAHNTIKLYGVEYDKTWIFDKIHHEINQFCSRHTLHEVYISEFERLDEELASALQSDCDKFGTGIEIISIRVTKPRIPPAVLRNFEQVEEEKTRLLVATQEQEVKRKQEETHRMQATIAAEREAEVALINARKEAAVSLINAEKELNNSRIHVAMEIAEKEGFAAIERIETQIQVERERAKAETFKYSKELEADAWKQLLTPEYLKMILYQSLTNNSKIFYGEKLPDVFLPWLGDSAQKDLQLN